MTFDPVTTLLSSLFEEASSAFDTAVVHYFLQPLSCCMKHCHVGLLPRTARFCESSEQQSFLIEFRASKSNEALCTTCSHLLQLPIECFLW